MCVSLKSNNDDSLNMSTLETFLLFDENDVISNVVKKTEEKESVRDREM